MDRGFTIDEKFIAKLKRGDVKSFHRLYDSVAPVMRLICRRYVKSDADADDVFQEGFLKVYKNISSLKSSEALMGWMKRIFINTALDHYKKENGRRTENIDDVAETKIDVADDEDGDWDEGALKAGEISYAAIRNVDFSREEMLSVLQDIPEHFRVVFQLFVIDEYKHQEIAEMLLMNEKTSKTRLLRARALLKGELNKLAIQKMRDGRSG